MARLPALNLAISMLSSFIFSVSGSDLSPENEYPNCPFLEGVSQSLEANTSIMHQTAHECSLPYL
jgi:hypothetical protein